MHFSTDELNDLAHIISEPRFATYLKEVDGDRHKALCLYNWNMNVSSAFIMPLHLCEVSTRNGVAEAIEKVHGATWPWSNGFLQSLPVPKQSKVYNPRENLEKTAHHEPTVGKIIASLNFAFWEKIFTKGQDARLWQPHMRNVFPHVPCDMEIKAIRATFFDELQYIRRFRNRIAHYEPIFSRNLHQDYARLLKIISWRSTIAADWIHKVQNVENLLAQRP